MYIVLLTVLFGYAVCQQCGVLNPNGIRAKRSVKDEANNGHTPYIVGGRNTVPGELPFQTVMSVTVKSRSLFPCGGTVISKRCVLTAAHCLRHCISGKLEDATSVNVTFGAYDVKKNDARASIVTSDIRIHSSFNPCTKSTQNDVAVIRFNSDIPLGLTRNGYKSVGTICLPWTCSDDFKTAQTSGWGVTDPNNPRKYSDVLKIAEMNYVSKSDCKRPEVDNTQVCAISQRSTPCNGDSGGPLFIMVNGKATQIGITSYGMDSCQVNNAGVFTRVKAFLPWIRQNCGNL